MTRKNDKLHVLFVCMGNICRSPLAEALFRHHVDSAELGDWFEIDSAGTSAYHEGDPPDPRASAVAEARGVTLAGHSRQIKREDLDRFDYVMVMDTENRSAVQQLVSTTPRATIQLLREFDELAKKDLNIPDPYYGGSRGFETVYDIVERSTRGFLAHLRKVHAL